MKNKYLFLDDIRQPYEAGNYMYPIDIRKTYRLEEWEIVRNYQEFCKWIEDNGIPYCVSFDHDLADIHYNPEYQRESFSYHEQTGYDCALFLIKYCIDNKLELPIYYCHSMNPVGKTNILELLNKFKNK